MATLESPSQRMDAALLAGVSIFKDIKPEQALELAAKLTPIYLKKGEYLFKKGESGDSMYILTQGQVKVSIKSKLGDEIVLAIFNPGDFFGEMALLDGMARSADAIAIRDSQLYVLKREDFYNFLAANFDAVRTILYNLSLRLRETDEMLADTCFLTVSKRFAKRLLKMLEEKAKREGDVYVLNTPMRQKEWAAIIGTSRESINKEVKTIKEKWILRLEKDKIIVLDIERLKRRAL